MRQHVRDVVVASRSPRPRLRREPDEIGEVCGPVTRISGPAGRAQVRQRGEPGKQAMAAIAPHGRERPVRIGSQAEREGAFLRFRARRFRRCLPWNTPGRTGGSGSPPPDAGCLFAAPLGGRATYAPEPEPAADVSTTAPATAARIHRRHRPRRSHGTRRSRTCSSRAASRPLPASSAGRASACPAVIARATSCSRRRAGHPAPHRESGCPGRAVHQDRVVAPRV